MPCTELAELGTASERSEAAQPLHEPFIWNPFAELGLSVDPNFNAASRINPRTGVGNVVMRYRRPRNVKWCGATMQHDVGGSLLMLLWQVDMLFTASAGRLPTRRLVCRQLCA